MPNPPPQTGTAKRRAVIGLLRDVDPTARQYAAIVVGVESYDDFHTHEVMASRMQDLHMLAGRLRLSDLADFPWSYPTWTSRWRAARAILLRGVVFQRDFQDPLLDPAGRLKQARDHRRQSAQWLYSFAGEPGSLAGLKVDWVARKIEFPPSASAAMRRMFQEALFGPVPPQQGHYSAYRRLWLGRSCSAIAAPPRV